MKIAEVDPLAAIKMATEKGKGQFRSLTSEEKETYGIPVDSPAQVNEGTGKVSTIGAKGATVNVDLGKTPAGHKKVYDEQGRFTHYERIPVKDAGIEEKVRQGAITEGRSAIVVKEDIQRYIDKVDNAPWYNPVTSVLGPAFEQIETSNRADAVKLKDTITANIGFDRLQRMRNESPTGGALGNVSNTELGQLQAVLGSVEPSQSQEQLLHNLTRLDEIYSDVIRKAARTSEDMQGLADATGISIEDLQRLVNDPEGLY
jgi:hypothetical protein